MEIRASRLLLQVLPVHGDAEVVAGLGYSYACLVGVVRRVARVYHGDAVDTEIILSGAIAYIEANAEQSLQQHIALPLIGCDLDDKYSQQFHQIA